MSMTGLYANRLPADVRANVQAHRTFAHLVAELGEQHDRHIAAIEATERRLADEDRAHAARTGGSDAL